MLQHFVHPTLGFGECYSILGIQPMALVNVTALWGASIVDLPCWRRQLEAMRRQWFPNLGVHQLPPHSLKLPPHKSNLRNGHENQGLEAQTAVTFTKTMGWMPQML